MIRFALRQFRTQAVVACGALAAIAIVFALTGPHLVHLYATTAAMCNIHGDCAPATSTFLTHDRFLQIGSSTLLLVAPAIVGIFWGGPLIARELEAGTFRLAWTQSVTLTRWLAVKLGLIGLASMAAVGVLSLMVTWWSSPFDRINMNWLSPGTFGERGFVPIGYAAFAFMLGALAGLIIRRTIPAMATTLVVYIVARFAVSLWIRPHLWTPLRFVSTFQAPSGNGKPTTGAGVVSAKDWVLSDQVLNGAGHVIGQNGGIGANGEVGLGVSPNGTLTFSGVGQCPNRVPPGTLPSADGFRGQPTHAAQQTIQTAFQTCIDRLHIREVITYQPAHRFWLFQGEEVAIFLALALLLAGFCFWWARRQYAGRVGRPRGADPLTMHLEPQVEPLDSGPERKASEPQLSVRPLRAEGGGGPWEQLRLVPDP